jgi:hypothetical protein
MTIYTYTLDPLQFCIESDCDTPEKALEEALQCGTPNEIGLLKYLHSNIEDYPTLNDSIECIDISED